MESLPIECNIQVLLPCCFTFIPSGFIQSLDYAVNVRYTAFFKGLTFLSLRLLLQFNSFKHLFRMFFCPYVYFFK